jgi:N-methylhydantoinase A/oxoprolinase/acetone carboxylase beta subunit
MTVRIGIDTGGTFTDFVRVDERGIAVHKLRSTPHDPSLAILAGIRELAPGQPDAITHGSTVATNAVLERKGVRVALVTTAGFEDVLLIGRQTRPELYNIMVAPRRPLIEPGMTFGVRERLAADGSVVTPLEDPEIARLIAALRSAQAASVAVCLLHSYANPAHEKRLAEALTEAGFTVSASHSILPEYREFERWSTTAVNAYVTPLMASYLMRLESGLTSVPRRLEPSGESAADGTTEAVPSSESGIASSEPCSLGPVPSSLGPVPSLRIMQSNGGSISARHASRVAVQTILSGPAAGVVGAQAVGAASGFTRLVTFDMGGTSTDVSLIDGAIGTTNESLVGDIPVRLPVLDIHTVGAGGGSIAYLDSGASLRVGPRSAGADPGPVCYGKGAELTVTDANLLLGRLAPEYFLGGRMALDLPRARAIAKSLAKQLKLTERALAEGIIRIANANMERAIRVVSVQRGFDPRDFALLAFGGAGGLHACDLAASLNIATVLIPRHSGVLSALGMLLADVVKDYSASVLKPASTVTGSTLREAFAPLLAHAQADLAAEGFQGADITLEPSLDMRYKGQAYEISVPFAPDFHEAFHRSHQKLYGYANPARATEIVQLRVKATGRTHKPSLTPPHSPIEPVPLPEPTAIRPAIFDKRAIPTPIFHRDNLTPGMSGVGPALIITGQSTNIITPSFRWSIDAPGTLVAEKIRT